MLASEIAVLSEPDRERIHGNALKVLERAGVRVGEAGLRDALRRRGAQGAVGADVVRMPRELVGECLKTVDRSPVLECVNGKLLPLGPDDRHYASFVTDPYIIDYRKGARESSLEDIARHARLCDALPLVDNIHLMDDTIPDLDSATSELQGLLALVSNTTTSYHCAPGTLRAARTWVEIAQIMAGGDLKKHPILLAYVPTVSPLILMELNTRQLHRSAR